VAGGQQAGRQFEESHQGQQCGGLHDNGSLGLYRLLRSWSQLLWRVRLGVAQRNHTQIRVQVARQTSQGGEHEEQLSN